MKSTCCGESAPVALKTVKQAELTSLQKSETSNSVAQLSNEPALKPPQLHDYSNDECDSNATYGGVGQSHLEKCSGSGFRQQKSMNGSNTVHANKMAQLSFSSNFGFSDSSKSSSPKGKSGIAFETMESQVALKTSEYRFQEAAGKHLLDSVKVQCFCDNRMLFLKENSIMNPAMTIPEWVTLQQLLHSVIRTNRPTRRKVNYEKRNANQCSSIGREQDCHR